ncbi:type II toxin-antitoxin system VapC family toxin [Endothiovibrio diazotrophicus]
MILLDTHALIWLDEGSPRLGVEALRRIDDALVGERLTVSAISFWEVAMLRAKGRLELQMGVAQWRSDLLAAGLRETPVNGSVGIVAAELSGFHGDPADRLIVATALGAGATLVTADRRILDWRGGLERCDASL